VTPVLEVAMRGGVVGLILLAVGISIWIWIRGDPPAERPCDCADCVSARADVELQSGNW